jgi:hypothetical protein
MFGKPTFVANVRHGYALWKTKGLFSEHLLIDEDVKHCVPRPHHDYFYSSVKFFLPKDKVCDVLKISGSINYDGLKKELTARCGALGANYATLYLGMLVGSGKMTISQVKKNDMYPRMIQGKILPYNKMAKQMMKLKRANNKRYKKQLKADFATYAYSECYDPKKNKTRRKKKKGGSKTRKFRNTKNKSCKKNRMTSCCPHMPPNSEGQYAATSGMKLLHYKGKKYELFTCCPMCAENMNKLAKTNVKKFDKVYKAKIDKNHNLKLSNKATGKFIQIARLHKRKTKRHRGGTQLIGGSDTQLIGGVAISDYPPGRAFEKFKKKDLQEYQNYKLQKGGLVIF